MMLRYVPSSFLVSVISTIRLVLLRRVSLFPPPSLLHRLAPSLHRYVGECVTTKLVPLVFSDNDKRKGGCLIATHLDADVVHAQIFT